MADTFVATAADLKAGATAVAPAWGAEVVSSNIVGYEKIKIYPGLNMIGGVFQGVGTGEALSLNDQFVDAATSAQSGAGSDEADNIFTYDGSTQEYNKIYYFYYEDGGADDENNKWVDIDTDAVTETTFSDGTGGWYRNRSNTTIELTMAGEVPTNATYTVTLYSGLNFVANPYPMAIALNGANFSVTGVTSGAGSDEADNIFTYDGPTQEYNKIYYFYYEDGGADEEINKWVDIDTDAVTDATVGSGQGFWYRHRGAEPATLTFTKPY